jgi:hypothetical protein
MAPEVGTVVGVDDGWMEGKRARGERRTLDRVSGSTSHMALEAISGDQLLLDYCSIAQNAGRGSSRAMGGVGCRGVCSRSARTGQGRQRKCDRGKLSLVFKISQNSSAGWWFLVCSGTRVLVAHGNSRGSLSRQDKWFWFWASVGRGQPPRSGRRRSVPQTPAGTAATPRLSAHKQNNTGITSATSKSRGMGHTISSQRSELFPFPTPDSGET